MDNFKGFGSKAKKTVNRPTNFIESLRDLSSSFKKQAKDASLGLGNDVFNQILGSAGVKSPQTPQTSEVNPNSPFNFEDFIRSRENQVALRERQHFQRRLQEEKLVYHRKQEEVKMQIKVVQEELKKLASATVGLSQEVKKATLMAVVDPGTYHENFFDRLRNLIELARKKIGESQTWLETFNHRSKQKSIYWGGVQKSGTKYMLSHERYMSTQAG